MAENEVVRSKRDQVVDRLRSRYPEKRFEDDDEIYGQIYDDYDQSEKELENYRGQEKQFSDLFASDPRNAQFLSDMYHGQDPVLGLVRRFGVEIKDVLDDPEMQDKIAEANKEYVERVAKSKVLDEEYEKNLDATLEMLRGFQTERGLSDEEIDEVMDALLGIVQDGVMGKFTRETVVMMLNAIHHDRDVSAASEEGRVAGRNDKIVESLRKTERGDGTAPLSGKNGAAPGGRRGASMFDIAREAM